MAGEAARPIARYPDDFQTLVVTIPVVGTGADFSSRGFVLFIPDDTIILDSATAACAGMATVGISVPAAATATLYKIPRTSRALQGSGATSAVQLTEALAFGAGTNAHVPFVLYPTGSTPTNNQVSAGEQIVASISTTGGTTTSGAVLDYWTFQIRYHSKRSFNAVGADELKKQ